MSEVEGYVSRQRPERKPRLFVGIAIDECRRLQCAAVADGLRARCPGLRFVEAENYHLTLAFLGNVEAARAAVMESALRTVALRHERFVVTLKRVGAFPHERKPHVIFIASRGTGPAYRELAADVRRECKELGFTIDEKDDIPHVTIARAPNRERVRLPLVEVPPISIAVDALTLFESVPHDGRVHYTVVREVELSPTAIVT